MRSWMAAADLSAGSARGGARSDLAVVGCPLGWCLAVWLLFLSAGRLALGIAVGVYSISCDRLYGHGQGMQPA